MNSILSALLTGLAQSQGVSVPAAQPQTPPVQPPNAGGQTVPASTKPADLPPTEVEAVEVTPPPRAKPNPPPIQYDNSRDVAAIQQAQADAPRVDGGTGAGIWGMLPNKIQHGTLRDVLGAIGDGFLMHEDKAPAYQNRVDSRRIGQAMAGYANNPEAAIERIANTGAPGSIEMADKLETNNQNLQIRKQIMEQTATYRQAMIQSRNDQSFQRMMPYAGGLLQGVNTPEQYKSVYGKLDAIAKRIDPEADPTSAWGIPTPDEWQPGMTATQGATTGQVMRNETGRASIAERAQAAGLAHQDRQAALRAHPQQITSAQQIQNIARKIDAGTATPAEQQIFNRYLHGTKGGGSSGLHPNTTGGGGTKPTPSDIAYLKQHPDKRTAFDAHFGHGASSQYLR